MRHEHPFHCHKKNCYKTAFNTPEYLTPADWEFLGKILKYLAGDDAERLYNFLWSIKNRENTLNFFNRVVGWPEGYIYCSSFTYFCCTGIRCLKNENSYPKLIKAYKNRPKQEKTS